MGTVFVARSPELSDWASDVGQSKHVYKLGYTEQSPKELAAVGWSGFGSWTILKKLEGVEIDSEEAMIERVARTERMLDPKLYPRLRGVTGVFKVLPAHVENGLMVERALSDSPATTEIKLKPADFAAYLLRRASVNATST
jgi:hypothetical protein